MTAPDRAELAQLILEHLDAPNSPRDTEQRKALMVDLLVRAQHTPAALETPGMTTYAFLAGLQRAAERGNGGQWVDSHRDDLALALQQAERAVRQDNVEALAKAIHFVLTVTTWHDDPCAECQKIAAVLRRDGAHRRLTT